MAKKRRRKKQLYSPQVAAEKIRESLAIPASKPGRPRIEDLDKTLEAQEPWVGLGMSKRTWFRRRREQRLLQSNA